MTLPSQVTGLNRHAVAADFRDAGWWHRIALAGVVFWLAYEWGPGNEAVSAWLVAQVIGNVTGVVVIPITAVIGFSFITAQQLVAGFTALAGFSIFDRTTQGAQKRLATTPQAMAKSWERMGLAGRAALVFGLGTTAVALLEMTTSGRTGVKPHARVVVHSAVLCGTIVALISAFAAAGTHLGRQFATLRDPLNRAVEILGSPLFWFIALSTVWVLRGARRFFRRSSQ